MAQSKTSAFLSVLLVFVGGVAVGGLGYRLYDEKVLVTNAPAPGKKGPPPSPEEVRKRVVARMKDAVKLDDAQIVELGKILDGSHEGFDQIKQTRDAAVDPINKKFLQDNQALRESQIAKVKAILHEDQQALYAKYLADREAEHKKWQQEHQGDRKDGKGPGFRPSRP